MGVDEDVGPHNFLDDVEYIIRLGKEHRRECLGCPTCNIIGTFVAPVRKEATASDFAAFRRIVFSKSYGGPGFGYALHHGSPLNQKYDSSVFLNLKGDLSKVPLDGGLDM